MIGKTNVGGGSQFSATLQVTTDPNAIITAVNPAGDTFGGTADSNGDLTLVTNHSGTYTVTETGGAVKNVVIADDGATYTVQLIAFDGTLISNGVTKVAFQTYNVQGSTPPSVTNATVSGESAIYLSLANGNLASYRTNDLIDISGYTSVSVRGVRGTGTLMVCAVDQQNEITGLGQLPSTISSTSFALSALDSTKKYRFGIHMTGGSDGYVVNLKLN